MPNGHDQNSSHRPKENLYACGCKEKKCDKCGKIFPQKETLHWGGPAGEYLIKTECANCRNISEKAITKKEAAIYTPLVNNLP